MTKILVTGATGFVGDHLCRALLNCGDEVVGVDKAPPTFEPPESVTLFQKDLTDAPQLPDADVVVHLAAHSQVQPVVEDPSLTVENLQITENVLSEAARMDAAVVNVSSRDVYGSAIKPPESAVTVESPNGYAVSKLAGEALTNAYRNTDALTVASLRLSNVYGPKDLNPRVIPKFVSLAAAGEELTVFGSGKLLDFVHINDVCSAVATAVERLPAINGEVINIGSGRGTTLEQVASRVAEEVNACPGWTMAENRDGDVSRYVSELSKSRALLDYKRTVEIDQGLRETIKWYLKNPGAQINVTG